MKIEKLLFKYIKVIIKFAMGDSKTDCTMLDAYCTTVTCSNPVCQINWCLHAVLKNDVDLMQFMMRKGAMPNQCPIMSDLYKHAKYRDSFTICAGDEALNEFETHRPIKFRWIEVLFAFEKNIHLHWGGILWLLHRFNLRCNSTVEFMDFEELLMNISDPKSVYYKGNHIPSIYRLFMVQRKKDILIMLDDIVSSNDICRIIVDYL